MFIAINRKNHWMRRLQVDTSDTVGDLKYKIYRNFLFRNDRGKAEIGPKILIFRILEILMHSTCDYETNRYSSPGFNLSVVSPLFSVIRFAVDAHTGILNLKQEIAAAKGMAASRQILRAGGEELQDDRTLGDYGIKDHAVIWLEFKSSRWCNVSLDVVASSVLGICVLLQALLLDVLIGMALRIVDSVKW
ncbi:polyubiquitin 8-like [Penaeus japonicus]|uniref:polyubiquitin 8-like n=1 Tax=Penaeus japonicus TaxID=27405 RepID=UPI001C70ED9C|nr:polyubiquitin 8-like [Penaeus japonicus]